MAIFLNETKPLNIYNGAYLYPINKKDKNKGSIVYFFTPNKQSSFNLLKYNMENGKLNSTLFQSYFIEKSVDIILNSTNYSGNKLNINNEQVEYDYDILEGLNYNSYNEEMQLTDNCLMFDDEINKYRIFFNEYIEDIVNEEVELLNEAVDTSKFNSTFKKLLYKQRMKKQQEVILLYDEIKEKFPFIKNTFVDPKLYKNRNVIYDWSFYTEIFFKNKKKLQFNADYNIELMIAFFNKFILDKRFQSYTNKTILIPVNDWCNPENNITNYRNIDNPISAMLRLLFLESSVFDLWKNYNIAFISNNQKFFTLDLQNFSKASDYPRLVTNLRKLITLSNSTDIDNHSDSKNVILVKMVNTLAQSGIKINNLTGSTSSLTKQEILTNGLMDNPTITKDPEVKKAVLVNKLDKIAEKSKSEEDAMAAMEEENEKEKEWMTQLLLDLQTEDGVKLDKVRAARHDKTQKELLSKVVKGKTVKELLEQFKTNNDIPESAIPVDNIDEHWQKVKYPNFNKVYTEKDMQADIVAMFHHFTTVTHPLNIININSENTSTSEDFVDTWTVNYEDAESGKRFTMKLDLPIMIDNRFMKLRGNEKTLIGQLMLLPIVKTDNDTVQIVSNYNKIFVRRKSPSGLGKSTPIVNKLCKVLTKYDGKDIKISFGDNRKICTKYELPISFVDMASQFSLIKFKDGSYIDFNLDNLKSIPFDRAQITDKKLTNLPEKDLENKYFACYVTSKKLKVPVDLEEMSIDKYIRDIICSQSETIKKEYESTAFAKRLMYSEASILATKIPIIVVCAYAIGLQRVLDKIGIKYEFSEKRPTKGNFFLKFNDGYLIYEARSDADHLLMNGLTQFDTEEYSISEINSKDMWLSVLDDFGGRIKADGLDNFYDLMMDPITVEICNILHIPSDYIGALLYASGLLVDNKYNKHSDITGNRLRVNEVIVGHLYQVLAKEFGSYRNMVKRNNKQAAFTAKQSAVIDSLLTHDQTSSDVSTMTPILEIETANKVTFKGLSGMNSDRAFSMDKRSYDKSMLGILSQSTGFAGTVGINRQLTIDAGVLNKRGFMSATKPKDLDNLSTLCAMEALAPMTANHNDPMRNAMMFVQSVSHGMTVRKAMPSLITSGMDEALVFLTGDKFAYKFKGKQGKVVAITDEYIIVEDTNSHKKDYIDLRETIRKNSDGGFYLTTKLSPNENIKVGSILKENDIVAYDHKSYSPSIGHGDRKNPNLLSYNLGTLSTVGILQTDLGFEDSCVVDEYVSEALATEFCVQKAISLPSTANIYFMVNKGEEIQEGNPMIIFTDSFEDEDANEILSSLAKDNDAFLSDIGRKQVHAKVSGKVQDIKIYRTCEISKLSPSLQKLVKLYESKIDKLKKVMKDNGIQKEHELEATSKLDQQGKLKNVDGILIEFYIKTVDKYGIGDKLVFGPTGLKGVNSYVVPKEDAATAEYYGDKEKISAFLTCSGIGARMTPSAITTGLLNKALIALTRQVQEELGIEWRSIQEIMTDFKSDY